ncbi:HigA family addiction module antitoxin [Cupriavidus agavae]|uniref:Addiction module HigA family antidote n=1 Tax=Cupriavidus agavae TaxID=1001822 RepID=A0A4Q7RGN6_9BURK|nr:HigA family addiction module antitoxin [Cupriavidus agavae]RZT31300.1 addiction module HigA family antidote [Cupriavidus agavae]
MMPIPREDLCHLDFSPIATGEAIWPVPAGTILLREFMQPNGLGPRALAVALRVPLPRIEGIVSGGRPVSPETALRLARFFGTSAEFWSALDGNYSLRMARLRAGQAIAEDVKPLTA